MNEKLGGGCVLVAVGLLVVTPMLRWNLFPLALWTSAVVGLLVAFRSQAKKMRCAANPSPPPPEEEECNEETQVTRVNDGAGYVVYPAGERVRYRTRRDDEDEW